MSTRTVVAIDGPAGTGKSTIAKRLADRLGFVYVDSGAMYRAVALWALRLGVAVDDAHRLEQLAAAASIEFAAGSRIVLLNSEDVTEAIRDPAVTSASSKVSAVPGVRRALVARQREIAARAPVVMEGRDIGSVVFPEAQVKVFLDADPMERARRRVAEMNGASLEDVAREIAERDRRDSTRADSPLRQAPDAEFIDTTRMSLDEVEERVLKLVRHRTSNGKDQTN
jgi:cytidylate kinase